MTESVKHIPIRILVVEDETIVALDLQNSLKFLGYDVVGLAASGSEAITKAGKTQPDLVVMDIMLRGDMDGVQAAETIHKLLGVPVIFLTACADESTLQRAKVTEPFGYMIKPFDERELHSHIEIALYKHRMERQLRESEERYVLATQGSNDGLWDWDVTCQMIYYSPRWKSMLGYAESEIGNSPLDWFDKIHPSDRQAVDKLIDQHLEGTSNHFESEHRILDAGGTYRWVLCRGMARRDQSGKAYRIAGSMTDITDRKVYHPLTGLPNQILFMDRLEHTLRRVKSDTTVFGVAVIEFGSIKTIASSFGYVLADQLLCRIAKRVLGSLSANETVAHFGNDDFILLLEGAQEEKLAASIASRLLRELEQPFELEGQAVYVTPYIGITLRTAEYSRPDEMVRDAYTAMHRAKDDGGEKFEIFNRKMRSSVVARLRLEADLRKALESGEFRVYYQPIVALKSGHLAGFEALVRWQRENIMMCPEDFLLIAESNDLLLPLERWILRESCLQMAQWVRVYGRAYSLNVNLSPRHYADPSLIKEVQDALQQSGFEPTLLNLEITESALMDKGEIVARTLRQLQDMRVQLHMDDFGTGYSSLSYLNRFPINSLKVDRSFVGKLGLSEETWKIVQAIVSLGKNLDMELIAEGIENLTQLHMLQTLKCDYGQGYYFAKPMAPETVDGLLSGRPPWMVDFEDATVRRFPRAVEA